MDRPADAPTGSELLGTAVLAISGAGLSTDSGIPDYRGPQAPTRTPMTFQEFVSSAENQQRYWARAHVGWSRFGGAEPNDGHRALVGVEERGRLAHLITQNVDGLHEAAGHQAVTALHGRISEVVCLDCGEVTERTQQHARMSALNPTWLSEHRDLPIRPDGDVELNATGGFVVPSCTACGGRLKPHVVFFGESVPKPRVEQCFAALDRADSVLALGTSLTVMSGLRFVRAAVKQGKPVVVVNRGETRADDIATACVNEGCSDWLGRWLESERGLVSPE